VAPAQRAEGASDPLLPLNSFFVAPNVWTKFSIRHPGVSYSEFLSYRAEHYRLHNESAKRFFADFSKDPSRREAILRERATRRAARRNLVDPCGCEDRARVGARALAVVPSSAQDGCPPTASSDRWR
jgi:hypothetical protein